MKSTIFTLLLLCTFSAAVAQEPTTAPTATAATSPTTPELTLSELATEVQTLKQKSSTWDKIRTMLKVSGYLQTGYEWSNTSSNFFIKRARINVTGNLTAKLDYKVQIEICSPTFLGEAYLRYRPFDQLGMQVGEFKIPFSIENTDCAPYSYEFIEYPTVLRKLVAFNDVCGISSTGRDMGGMLFGSLLKRDGYSILSYRLAVLNGEGINTKDANRSKDLAAKLCVQPLRGLEIAGSYYWGEYSAHYLKRDRYGIGAAYNRGHLLLRGEYVYGVTEHLDPETEEVHGIDSDGWYATGCWRFTPKWEVMARYDTFRNDVETYATTQNNYTAGVLWSPIKHLRCQLNYTYENQVARDRANRNVVALMLTGIF